MRNVLKTVYYSSLCFAVFRTLFTLCCEQKTALYKFWLPMCTYLLLQNSAADQLHLRQRFQALPGVACPEIIELID